MQPASGRQADLKSVSARQGEGLSKSFSLSFFKDTSDVQKFRDFNRRCTALGAYRMQSGFQQLLEERLDGRDAPVGSYFLQRRKGAAMNAIKIMVPLTILGAVFLSGIWFTSAMLTKDSGPPIPPISRIQAMSDLATLRVQIADSFIGENEHWEVRWMLHGEAVLGVDLSHATYISMDEDNRRAVLSLPKAHVISSKVDHHRSVELAAKQKTLLPSPGLKSLRDEAWQHADEKVARLARHEGYLEATTLQAERVLDHLFRDVGWTITYEWRAGVDTKALAEGVCPK